MITACFRFYAELNYFLPRHKKQKSFYFDFPGHSSIKQVIESLGIPHTEIDLILVNGSSVGFSYLPRDGDKISVYPVFESLNITTVSKLRPFPLRDTKFVLDIHLGKLATYLRILGFDTYYRNDSEDQTLAEISNQENRILLTRDRGLLKRNLVTHGYCIRSTQTRQQLKEVIQRFDLIHNISPLKRCLKCNGTLEPVEKKKILDQLEPKTKIYYDQFFICTVCNKVYWKGSHYQKMRTFVEKILLENGVDSDLPL